VETHVVKSVRVKRVWRRPRRWSPRREAFYDVICSGLTVIVWYSPWRGLRATRSRRDHMDPGVWHTHYDRWGAMKKRTPKPAGADPAAPMHLAPLESAVFTKLFNIVQHCCVTRYDDGDARKPGWITIKTQGAAWVVQVKDPDGCAQLQCLGNTLDDALSLADLLLGSDDAPWEPDPWAKAAQTRKK